jgi:hypothetical protein
LAIFITPKWPTYAYHEAHYTLSVATVSDVSASRYEWSNDTHLLTEFLLGVLPFMGVPVPKFVIG